MSRQKLLAKDTKYTTKELKQDLVTTIFCFVTPAEGSRGSITVLGSYPYSISSKQKIWQNIDINLLTGPWQVLGLGLFPTG